MNIQVGQWYRGRGEGFIAQVVGKVFDDSYPFCVVVYHNGAVWDTAIFTSEGLYFAGETHELDLAEHLPDCTGPDWKPKTWRPATIDDLENGLCSARFRDSDQQKWIESYVCGVRWVESKMYWQECDGGYWWTQCEVLDDPS